MASFENFHDEEDSDEGVDVDTFLVGAPAPPGGGGSFSAPPAPSSSRPSSRSSSVDDESTTSSADPVPAADAFLPSGSTPSGDDDGAATATGTTTTSPRRRSAEDDVTAALVARCGYRTDVGLATTSTSATTTTTSPNAWRTRDLISDLALSRATALSAPSSSPRGGGGGARQGRHHHRLPPPPPRVSNAFDVDGTLARIRSSVDVSSRARAAFDAAAIAVLSSVLFGAGGGGDGEDDDAGVGSDDDNDNDDESFLPALSKALGAVAARRDAIFLPLLTSRRGKKRPTPMLSSSATTPAVDAVEPSSSSSSKKRRGGTDGLDGDRGATANSDASIAEAAAAAAAASSSSAAVVPGGAPSPSVSRPYTSAATAPAIDSRATVSRAILCAAASVAFSELTPDYDVNGSGSGGDDNDDDDEEGKIDVLDVPQNAHYRREKKKKQKQKKRAKKKKRKIVDLDGNEVIDDDDGTGEGDATDDDDTSAGSGGGASGGGPVVNMGAVLLQAETLGKRAAGLAVNAAGRSKRRHQFRVRNAIAERIRPRAPPGGVGSSSGGSIVVASSSSRARFELGSGVALGRPGEAFPFPLRNPFALSSGGQALPPFLVRDDDDALPPPRRRWPRPSSTNDLDDDWLLKCKPRLHAVLSHGAGHAVYHDRHWTGRFLRVADFLRSMATPERGRNFGPHLVVCAETDLDRFAVEFDDLGGDGRGEGGGGGGGGRGSYGFGDAGGVGPTARLVVPESASRSSDGSDSGSGSDSDDVPTLRALTYEGRRSDRRRLRYHFGRSLTSLRRSPYHVVLTSYRTFLEDYVHFCHVPWQVALLDDGMGWLGLAHHDPNGTLGRAWEGGIWSRGDGGVGTAGVDFDEAWDFDRDDGDVDGGRTDNEEDDDGDDDDIIGDDDGGGGIPLGCDEELDEASGGGGPTLISSPAKSKGGKRAKTKKKKKKKDKTGTPPAPRSPSTPPPPKIGLTARHRLLTARSMTAVHRDTVYAAPVPALLSVLLPQFAEVVREEWDRSRIQNDERSMRHFKRLLARCVVVHARDRETDVDDDGVAGKGLRRLAVEAMEGTLPAPPPDVGSSSSSSSSSSSDGTSSGTEDDSSSDGDVGTFLRGGDGLGSAGGRRRRRRRSSHRRKTEAPTEVPDEEFVSSGKIVQSRRFALSWLSRPSDPHDRSSSSSHLRSELGLASLRPILSAIASSDASGHVCEEVVTASSTTSSGAGGTVSGTLAYRPAVRCGRTFGSEQGLRQHMAALHAPPGTWLCRTCGGDCGTSQARTHHERYCGTSGVDTNPAGGATSTVGQGVGSGHGGGGAAGGGKPGSKKSGGAAASGGGTAGAGGAAASGSNAPGGGAGGPNPDDKDEDGSFRVPGYRGVWVNPAGRHFVKVDGVALRNDGGGEAPILFDTPEEAARRHDEVVTARRREREGRASGGGGGGGAPPELNYGPDGKRIVYEDSTAAAAAGRGLEMLGGGASSVVPALSVINIKDLPKDVKPLLRDPKQTSRTGGNSKRYVYAYRGVCRQARKGHDRWQSQISFGGTNHYLGTFDSEWDAAAIYAWAHLILYGEEATKKAQREGEEAAAAYEQEKKDIAAGKIIPQEPKKTKKKKKKPSPKKEVTAKESIPPKPRAGATSGASKAQRSESVVEPPKSNRPHKKRPLKILDQEQSGAGKGDGGGLPAHVTKGVTKVASIAPREPYSEMNDDALVEACSTRILAGHCQRANSAMCDASISEIFPACVPVSESTSQLPAGCFMLVGLSASNFGWDVESFLSSCRFESGEAIDAASSALNREYRPGGDNQLFRAVVHGSLCLIGRAGREIERASHALGLNGVPLGGTGGDTDCNIGGTEGSCSEVAALIRHSPTDASDFQFSVCNDDDIVTLNGRQIKAEMGLFPLHGDDVCSVGSRVFVFILPSGA